MTNCHSRTRINLISVILLAAVLLLTCPQRSFAATNVSGTISADTTWTKANSPYVITGNITVATGKTLTIEAGAVVKFASGSQMYVSGTLIADGTPAEKIYFTSVKDDSAGGDTNGDGTATVPAKSDWQYLYFYSASTNNVLDNVVERYANYGLWVYTSSLTVSNSVLEQNGSYGISSDASPTITSNEIKNNGSYGITLLNSSAIVTSNVISNNGFGMLLDNAPAATITGNTITNNTGIAIMLNISSLNVTIGNDNTMTGNGKNYIGIRGTLSTNMTWGKQNNFVVDGNITVATGKTLTIEAGAVVKFASGSQMYVSGTLIADGTPAEKIYFTSVKDDSVGGDTNGDGTATSPAKSAWQHLYFYPASTNNVLDNAVVRYADNGINAFTSSLTVSNSTIEQNDYGIYIYNVSPTITGNEIKNNAGYGINLLLNANPAILHNNVTNNLGGILYVSPSQTVTVIENYWGDVTGPYHATTNAGGKGNSVSNYITYSPWLKYPWIDTDQDGIADDGNDNGVVGDSKCAGGNAANCDDNCKEAANTDQADSDNDGIGNVCDPCTDIDKDGYAVEGSSCGQVDCDDSKANIHPGADDGNCNSVDENCTGTADDEYVPLITNCGIGECARAGQNICQSGTIVNTCAPGTPQAETCDNKDNDCDGQTDESLTQPSSCGVGECARTGNETCTGGAWGSNTCTTGNPTSETCDNKDNDCDGTVDENAMNTYYRDYDNDGYGDPSITTQACTQPEGYISDNSDCDDNNPAILDCNTPESNIPVVLTDTTGTVEVTLPNVTQGGDMTITAETCDNNNIRGITLILGSSFCVDVQTTAIWDGQAEVCMTYVQGTLTPEQENVLEMISCDGTTPPSCEVLTVSSRDTANNMLCALTTHFSYFAVGMLNDTDFDGAADLRDNCINISNTDQKDDNYPDDDNINKDGIQHYGDLCDPDFDNDGLVTLTDYATWRKYYRQDTSTAPAFVDLDGDNLIGLSDYAVWREYYRGTPGP